MRIMTVLAALALAPSLLAQISIGNYTIATNSAAINLTPPSTVVDTHSGATSDGNIGAVAVRFAFAACSGEAFKVKFFRLTDDTLTMTAERGPFAVTSSLTRVTLTPPVPVLEGDLIGITELKACANTTGFTPVLFNEAYHFEGDVTTATLTTGYSLPGFTLAAYGAENENSEVLTHVILAAGATAGAGGAQFKTDVSVGNLQSNRSRARLVYHPAGTIGSSGDPSHSFDLDPQRTLSLPNFVVNNLGRTGVGSVDVYTTIGYEPPNIGVRIYDDAVAAGTKGFTMEAVRTTNALQPFENALLFAPQDTTRYRMNVGIRTLAATEVQFLHLDKDGTQRAFVARSYPSNYFIQGNIRDFTGVEAQSGDQLIVYSQQKAFFAYASIVDNATNDPSIQIAKQFR